MAVLLWKLFKGGAAWQKNSIQKRKMLFHIQNRRMREKDINAILVWTDSKKCIENQKVITHFDGKMCVMSM